jgi:hypothetical protein
MKSGKNEPTFEKNGLIFNKNECNSRKTDEIRKKRVKFDKNETSDAFSGLRSNQINK